MARSRLNDRALLDGNGSVFMPATVENAQILYERYGAAPADPDRFPWRCAAVSVWHCVRDASGPIDTIHAQCGLVADHVGEHRTEMGW